MYMVCTHNYVMQHVIVQCISSYSENLIINSQVATYLYVRSSVIDNLFTLFPALVAGLVFSEEWDHH